MEQYEYTRIPVNVIPAVTCSNTSLHPLSTMTTSSLKYTYTVFPKPASSLTIAFFSHLAKFGYVPAKHTPGLFPRTTTRPILFSLVVDNFGVQYTGREHVQHLDTALESLYTIATEWSSTRYLGLTLDWGSTPHAPSTGSCPATLHRLSHVPSTHRTPTRYPLTVPRVNQRR
jgi:hypothetical protein